MKQETEKWIEQSEKDLKAAESSLHSENYEWASFQAHQATEKSLKALHIKKHKNFLKTHDLVLLSRKIDAPNNIVTLCSKINPSYLDTRYPDVPKSYSRIEAEEIVSFAKEVIEWIKENLEMS